MKTIYRYSHFSTLPVPADFEEIAILTEDYSSVKSVVDKSKFIPESQTLTSAGMTLSGSYDPPGTTLDSPLPVSRRRGADIAEISTDIKRRTDSLEKKRQDSIVVARREAKVDAELRAALSTPDGE